MPLTINCWKKRLSSFEEERRRPPFAYLYLYVGAWNTPVNWEDAQPITDLVDQQADDILSLPAEQIVVHMETDYFRLFPEESANYAATDTPLRFAQFGWTRGLEDAISIVDGAWPVAPSGQDNPIEILISTALANETGFQVGDRFRAFNPRTPAADRQSFVVQVAGVWEPTNPDDAIWYYPAAQFAEMMFVPEATYSGTLAPALADEVFRAAWYLVMDGNGLGTSGVDRLVEGEVTLNRRLDALLPGTRSLNSLADALNIYRADVAALTAQLLVYNLPSVALVLAFVWLVVGLAVARQRNEIAITRSRGGSPTQIIGMAIWQGVVLGVLAFGLGTLLSLGLAQFMGKIRSFLDFSAQTSLRVILSPTALRVGGVTVLLAVVAQLVPTISAAEHTIITYKQEQARLLKRPWWQRAWLDIILFLVAAYGYYQLQLQGSLFFGDDAVQRSDLFQNPLLLLLPSLFTFAVTLFFLRVLPILMEIAGRLLLATNSIGLLQAVRYLAPYAGAICGPTGAADANYQPLGVYGIFGANARLSAV